MRHILLSPEAEYTGAGHAGAAVRRPRRPVVAEAVIPTGSKPHTSAVRWILAGTVI